MQTHLLPTPAGTHFAVETTAVDPQRAILLGLLRYRSPEPMPLEQLAKISGMTDRKKVGQVLFKMQRIGWLNSVESPITLSNEPIQSAIEAILASLADSGQAVLADSAGMCIAYTGFSLAVSQRLSALGVTLLDSGQPAWVDPGYDGENTGRWYLSGRWGDVEATFVPLRLGSYRFMLATGSGSQLDSPNFTRLIALLGRRYLGEL